MISCPNCNHGNINTAKFCANCGAKLGGDQNVGGVSEGSAPLERKPVPIEDTKQCPHCGEIIKKEAIFCRYCKRDLVELTSNGEKPKRLTGWQIGLIVCLVLAILLFVLTNPVEEKHTQVIYSHIGEVAGQTLAGDLGGWLGEILGGAVGNLANLIDLSIFDYHNYLIFSTMTLNDKVISLGILSNVMIITPVDEWIEDLDINLPDVPPEFPTSPPGFHEDQFPTPTKTNEIGGPEDQFTPTKSPNPTQPIKTKTPPPPPPGSIPTGYLIVVSAFGHYDKAVSYNQRWIEAGFPVVIYYRNGNYRNAIPGYSTRQEAEKALPKAHEINERAYIVELPAWCPSPTRTATYIACGATT